MHGKTERYLLGALCLGACVWSVTMIVGVVKLARLQGPPSSWGLLELAAFVGAGLLPLLLIQRPNLGPAKLFLGAWLLCIAYVTLLGLNMLRLGHFTEGTAHLALWIAITVLLLRTLRVTPPRG